MTKPFHLFSFFEDLAPYDGIYKSLLKIHHVVQVHGLKVWSLTVNQMELICHLGISPLDENCCLCHGKCNGKCEHVMEVYNSVLEDATSMLRTKYHIETCTIQIEIVKEVNRNLESLESCKSCQPLKR